MALPMFDFLIESYETFHDRIYERCFFNFLHSSLENANFLDLSFHIDIISSLMLFNCSIKVRIKLTYEL